MSHLTGLMPEPHLAGLCCHGPDAPLVSEDSSGSGQALGWQSLSLKVWEHLLQRCYAFWHHCLSGPRIRFSDEPQRTGKMFTEWEGMGYKNTGTNGVTHGPPP